MQEPNHGSFPYAKHGARKQGTIMNWSPAQLQAFSVVGQRPKVADPF
jgi:hypothetical protein